MGRKENGFGMPWRYLATQQNSNSACRQLSYRIAYYVGMKSRNHSKYLRLFYRLQVFASLFPGQNHLFRTVKIKHSVSTMKFFSLAAVAVLASFTSAELTRESLHLEGVSPW